MAALMQATPPHLSPVCFNICRCDLNIIRLGALCFVCFVVNNRIMYSCRLHRLHSFVVAHPCIPLPPLATYVCFYFSLIYLSIRKNGVVRCYYRVRLPVRRKLPGKPGGKIKAVKKGNPHRRVHITLWTRFNTLPPVPGTGRT